MVLPIREATRLGSDKAETYEVRSKPSSQVFDNERNFEMHFSSQRIVAINISCLRISYRKIFDTFVLHLHDSRIAFTPKLHACKTCLNIS